MATTIYFAAAGGDRTLGVTVKENTDEVFRAWREGAGLPFALTESGRSERKVWINPATVAYWHEVAERSERTRFA